MNSLITRLQRRSRVVVGSSMAVIVALPLAAALGMGVSAAAAAETGRAADTARTTTTSDKTSGKSSDKSSDTSSTKLGKAEPWTLGQTADAAAEAAAAGEQFDALLFNKTAAFPHTNIPVATAAIQQLGADNNFNVTVTADSTAFTDANLEQYEVVIFLSTTGDVLNETQQGAFERYIQAGGGYAGIHAASDTEYDWPWYGNLVGAYFNNHPNGTPTATVKVEDPAHPSTAGLPKRWERTDEWYNFRTNPATARNKIHILASLDETTYAPGTGAMGVEHPIAWCQDYDGGRSWYTGMGHTDASFADANFLKHILGGIETAAGVVPSDCKATLQPSFEKVALDENTTNPMELAIADDGRVFYIDRAGAVKIILPSNGSVVTAGTVPVYTGQEFGLLGIALDPDFATNNHVFLYYAPQGTASIDRISRFTMNGNTLDLSSAVTILDVPVQRNECCHAGGSMEFDHDGNLYLATGDNTNPFDSNGFNPIDERPGREAWDAQRTSANTNDLNGKVLKIKPSAGGGYTIPAGNLFDEAADTQQKTRPEIYAMGFRNPFRIGLDEQNNKLLVADYGPDSGSTSATRGPNGRVEWNILNQPGNYGWPYCVGANTPYNDYNFASGTAGATFNCAAPVNDSPNNTGLTNLPPAKAAVIWQSNNASITGTPEIGASGAPMTSGTYDYDPDLVSDRKWPAYFDEKAIWADWNNSRLFTVQMNDGGTNYTDINRFLPNLQMRRPHALQFGPDGALYMIEWGSGFDGNNADSGVYRIDYVEGERSPTARATTDKTSGAAPLTVNFDGTGSFDGDTGSNVGLTYAWDFTSDGTVDATSPTASFTYNAAGNYTARLTVTAANGKTGTTNIDIVAGNSAPVVDLQLPLNGGFFEFGDTIKYKVVVTDAEDGTIDCSKVIVQPGLGHDQHSHGYEQYTGCEGSFVLPGDAGHSGANVFGTVTATYKDGGNGAAGSLTGIDGAVLHTKKKEAEFYDQTGRTGSNTAGTAGVATQTTTDTNGGLNVTGVETGDWFRWDVMNLTNITGVTMRAASTTTGATFEVRQGSPTGTAIGTLTVPNTGGAQTWQNVSTTFTGATTTSVPLYFVATTGGANVNWVEFAGRGVTDNTPPTVSISASKLTGSAPLPVDFTSTVSDADNDAPFTYAWSFGDTTTSTAPNPSKTYSNPGKYTVSLTVTDARGAKTTKTTEITVTAAAPICFSGRSDDFLGTSLDTSRWNQSVRVNQSLTVADGTLNIPLTNSDLYQTTNTTPNIVLQNLPGGAFEATTKVTLNATKGYQQGGLIVYGDDNNYLKLVYSGRSTAAAGSKAANIIQFAKEVNATATETNSANLGAAFPDTVWLRLSSTDGNSVTASYSSDGATWLPVTAANAARDLTGITSPRIGLLALGATAAGAADNLTAKFDYFTLTPDDTAVPCATPCQVEQFNGNALDLTSWNRSVRVNDTMTVADGTLNIPLTNSDLYQTTNTTPNVVLRDLPTGKFVVTTKVTLNATKGYQQGGLTIYGDDDNYIKLVYSGRSTAAAGSKAANIIQFFKETNAVASETNGAALGAAFPDTVWLRLSSTDGNAVTASYSSDGATWLPVTAANAARDLTGITAPKVGLVALGATAAGAADNLVAKFDFFTLGQDDTCQPGGGPSDTTAPTTTLTIPLPNGQAGWYNTRPSFTLAATDNTGGSGVASTEYRIDGGTWTPYTTAVSVPGEGTKLIEYRSKDSAGNVESIKSQTVKIDTVDPTVTSATAGTTTKTVTLTATDATSGVASIEYQIGDATTWTTYSTPLTIDEVGTKVVRFRATDVAGNVSDVGTTTVVVDDSTKPEVGATVLGSYAGELVDQASTGVTGEATMVSAADGSGFTTTVELTLAGLDPSQNYESHLHIGTTCGGFAGHYRDDPAGDGVPPNELWPTNPGWTAGSGEARIKAAADGTSFATATVPWAPRIQGGILALHRDGAIIGCVDLDLTGPGTVVLDATDDVDVTSLTYTVDGGAETAYDGPFEITAPGTHVVSYTAKDAADNTTTGSFEVVVPQGEEPPVETAKPSVAITTSPAAANGRKNWFTAPVTVTLAGSGGTGNLNLEYRIGNGPWTAYTAPFTIKADGVTLVQARATDTTGKTSAVETVTIKMDATAPTLSISGIADKARLDVAAVRQALVNATDATSGVTERVVRLDGALVDSPTRIDALSLRSGSHTLSVTVTDEAGNQASSTIGFKVVASYGGAKKLVKRLDREDTIGAKLGTKLKKELKAVKRADKSKEKGEARKAIKRFTKLASKVDDAEARKALKHLARTLKKQL
ncbi:ThuA domain-containing protein [Nocardioides baculatus]|uniref:ThuA domain-containing protein n=1 Tax=Nocardioides baculatus TaxID=2801337 RepID=A0ABS1L6M3_9ACTN|nr:ThuA domain-containing protein [Nocardioides baculatus]MBL0747088.1 ThuA domain-containing protein [Nocardioides baculatus]